MALKLPKKLGVSVKPVNEWGGKEVGAAVGAAVGGPLGPIIGGQLGGGVEKMRADAASKRSAGEAARAAEAERVAQEYSAERNASRGMLEGMAGTTIPGVSAAALDPAFRNSQLQLLQQLTQQSQGQGPSLAQMQFQQSGNTALQKAMGAIRAATGTNAALGGRTAALASTNLLGNIAAESGMARLKEQQDAQRALGELSAAGRVGDLQARQQDINMGSSNAELGIKDLLRRQQAAEGLLGDTRTRFENHYGRGAQIQAAGMGGKGGGSDSLLPAVLGAAGAIGASIYGSPAAAPAGAAAGQAAGQAISGGAGLVGTPAQPTQRPATVKGRPFGRMTRKG